MPEQSATQSGVQTARAAFTPGDWVKWRLSSDSDPQERLIITTADGETEICGIVENEADADLIAAAPKLYEALEELRSTLRPVLRDHEVRGNVDRTEGHVLVALNKIDAALATARGR